MTKTCPDCGQPVLTPFCSACGHEQLDVDLRTALDEEDDIVSKFFSVNPNREYYLAPAGLARREWFNSRKPPEQRAAADDLLFISAYAGADKFQVTIFVADSKLPPGVVLDGVATERVSAMVWRIVSNNGE